MSLFNRTDVSDNFIESDYENISTSTDIATAEKYKSLADNLYSKGSDYLSSINYYNKALRICPVDMVENRSIYFADIGACYLKMEQYKHVVDACSKSLRLNPRYSKALQRRAKANETLDTWGSLQDAIQDYELLVTIETDHALIMTTKSNIARLKPRMQKFQEQETQFMMAKLKELDEISAPATNSTSSILKPFGIKSDMFRLNKNDQQNSSYPLH